MRFCKESEGGPASEVDSMEIKFDFVMGGKTNQASFNVHSFLLFSEYLSLFSKLLWFLCSPVSLPSQGS
jgi:hypothetical protein